MNWLSDLFHTISTSPRPTTSSSPVPTNLANANELLKPLQYLITAEEQLNGSEDFILEVGYDGPKPLYGPAIKYANLFNQTEKDYGPYVAGNDTAQEYGEKKVDPKYPGWLKLLDDQFADAKKKGFKYIELDNPDGYNELNVMQAVGYAQNYGLQVIAKNPGACSWDANNYMSHPNVVGMIVEKDAGTPYLMDAFRRRAQKPLMPIWFVCFKDGHAWGLSMVSNCKPYKNMWVSYSPDGEYTSSLQLGSSNTTLGVNGKLVQPSIPGMGLLNPFRVVDIGEAQGAKWSKDPKHVNIFYIEGCNPDGTPNNNQIDQWNDIRGLLQWDPSGKPQIIFKCKATTEPGVYYDRTHIINPKGAALVAPGWQECWQIGTHHAGTANAHEALVQTGAEVQVYRDRNRSFQRKGPIDVGWFGVNQHGTGPQYDGKDSSVEGHSAGCLVAEHMVDHREFMKLLKTDQRYIDDHKHIFGSIVMVPEWFK